MLLSELYQEQSDSTFTHDGKEYSINRLLRTVDRNEDRTFKVSDLDWIIDDSVDVDERRVKRADTSKPILVVSWEGKLVVVDGFHRLVKAKRKGDTEMVGKKVTQKQLHTALIDNADVA